MTTTTKIKKMEARLARLEAETREHPPHSQIQITIESEIEDVQYQLDELRAELAR